MPSLRSHRPWGALVVVALLVGACVTTAPTDTSSPSLAPGQTATASPLETSTPGTTAPTLPPTAPPSDTPTVPPSDGPHPNWPPGAIAAGHADEVVGQNVTICGNVDTVRWLESSKGHPTWINFNRAYPNMKFNGLIWGEERREWSLNNKPEVMYAGQQICVTGLVETYNGWYQIQNLHKADIVIVQP